MHLCIQLPWQRLCLVDVHQTTDVNARCPPTGICLAKLVSTVQARGNLSILLVNEQDVRLRVINLHDI
ncbi:hypothetical protein BLA18110_03423 [Burkholderia lata]|nr:hypothetical protein BLA18110_03423 [Burkholderia lata]